MRACACVRVYVRVYVCVCVCVCVRVCARARARMAGQVRYTAGVARLLGLPDESVPVHPRVLRPGPCKQVYVCAGVWCDCFFLFCVCVRVCVCVRARARACVRAHVCVWRRC